MLVGNCPLKAPNCIERQWRNAKEGRSCKLGLESKRGQVRSVDKSVLGEVFILYVQRKGGKEMN